MPKASSAPQTDRSSADFLTTVLRSGLLDREQLQATLRKVPLDRRHDPQLLADYLVKTGKLSRFQARKLLQGTAGGLVMGPFQVLAPIGRGGMGTVYLARDSRSQTLLALKILPPKHSKEENRHLARFRREMEMNRRVAHPHLAWTYEASVCQGVYYIAMEYIPGKSLYRLVAQNGPLSVPRAARLFAEVAAALDHAHHQGLIHRDLKPSNIMITPNDHAKVLDLGLALMEGEDCSDLEVVGGRGYVVGTMDYLAPEQAADATNVDARSDIYSLGCSLYYALTGQPPFAGGTPIEKMQRHRNDDPVPVPELNPAVPHQFISVLRRMIAKKPENRFSSAAALREELLSWATGEKALPLDQPQDSAYARAVTELEEAEPAPEMLQYSIPVGQLVPARKRRPPSSPIVSAMPVEDPQPLKKQIPWRWLAILSIASSIALLAGLLWYLNR